jgi:aspartate racemase
MSWPSTIEYYRIINEEVTRRRGGLHSARILLYSVDFGEIERMQRLGQWEAAGERLAEAARALERAGADFLLICAGTMHKVAQSVRQAIRIPLVHVADVTAEKIRSAGLHCVGLLGTRYTMEQDFLKRRFSESGLNIVIPREEERKMVHRIIFEELCKGVFLPHSRSLMSDIMSRMADRGAEGVILGCTEISLLVPPQDAPLPVFDTTVIHAVSAAEMALEADFQGDRPR